MKRAKVLNRVEIRKLLKVTALTKHCERNRLVIFLSYLAGLRACEIAALRVGDVLSRSDDIKPEVYLRDWQTKGQHAQVVMFNDKLRCAIRRYLSNHPRLAESIKLPLLVSQKGKGFSSQSIQNLFRHLYALAGIEHASSHSGRRTFITQLSENGISTRVIQELARHSSMATTQRYIDVSVDKLRTAVDLVSC